MFSLLYLSRYISVLEVLLTCSKRYVEPLRYKFRTCTSNITFHYDPFRSDDNLLRSFQMLDTPFFTISVTSGTNIKDLVSPHGRPHACHCISCPGSLQYITLFVFLGIQFRRSHLARKYVRFFGLYRSLRSHSCG